MRGLKSCTTGSTCGITIIPGRQIGDVGRTAPSHSVPRAGRFIQCKERSPGPNIYRTNHANSVLRKRGGAATIGSKPRDIDFSKFDKLLLKHTYYNGLG